MKKVLKLLGVIILSPLALILYLLCEMAYFLSCAIEGVAGFFMAWVQGKQ